MPERAGLTWAQALLKRTFDVVLASAGLVAFGWLIVIAAAAATLDTGRNGFFVQRRIGRYGKPFSVIKIRTMREVAGVSTTVTAAGDCRITRLGRLLRRTKLDELPQLLNVVRGDMSFVGPRPDVAGYADRLDGGDRVVLSVRPGITGPATLKFRDEEALLAAQPEPERYNREVIWPEKVRINRRYVENWCFLDDVRYIWRTLIGN